MKPRRATYADLEAVPADKVAELIQGTLYVMPRPAPKHTTAASRLGFKIGGPFDLGERGPGGWRILIEPELRFPDPSKPGAFDALVPDLAGWRLERLPVLPSTAYFSLAPDWICEVLSTSTEEHDREVKMPVYAREGVAADRLVRHLHGLIVARLESGAHTLRQGGEERPAARRGAAV